MRKIELTISPNYVPSWGLWEAVRELFQNALDQEVQCTNNAMSWTYDKHKEQLTIGNRESILTIQTLLLGNTSKDTDKNTIGQFGEGYKVATLALLRAGYRVTFYNYGAKEIWRPRFVQSRKFGAPILTFFIESVSIWNKTPSNDLEVVVEGISEANFEQYLCPNILMLRKTINELDYTLVHQTEYGEIINIPGNIYVNGLFVCKHEQFKYGYNFLPSVLELDRDRKLISDFDLSWNTSKMWVDIRTPGEVMELITTGAKDVLYLTSTGSYSEERYWSNEAYKNFISLYGNQAIPVTNQAELSKVPKSYKGIVVPEINATLIRSSCYWVDIIDEDRIDGVERLLEWFDKIKDNLTDTLTDEFNDIIEQLKADRG